MYLKSKKISFLILAITASICSGTLLHSFDDPEGPNLLIVMVLATILYAISIAAYSFRLSDRKRFWGAILIQSLLSVGLYIVLGKSYLSLLNIIN